MNQKSAVKKISGCSVGPQTGYNCPEHIPLWGNSHQREDAIRNTPARATIA